MTGLMRKSKWLLYLVVIGCIVFMWLSMPPYNWCDTVFKIFFSCLGLLWILFVWQTWDSVFTSEEPKDEA